MRDVEYPHPVLQSDGYDFKDECRFEISFDESRQQIVGNEIVLTVGYKLDCKSLEDMTRKDEAEVCVVAQSPSASYRRMYPIANGLDEVTLHIGKYDVAEKIELSCAIVSKSEREHFALDDFNPVFFGNAVFKINKGALLALTDRVVLYLDDSELEKPVTSIFSINRVNGQTVCIQPDFSSETGKIEINLCEEAYARYSEIEAGYAKTFRRCLTEAIVLPVLAEAIDRLRWEYDEFCDLRWARVIEKKLEGLGVDRVRDSDESSVTLADRLLGEIVLASLDTFNEIIDERSGYDDYAGGVD